MPRCPIDRATNFIVEDESWTVVEYDHSSVPGIIYLSLTEGKVNSIYDDTINDIADLDKRAKYEVVLPPTKQQFAINDEIKDLTYTIMKNGIPIDPQQVSITYSSNDKSKVKMIEGKLIAVGEGEVNIILNITEYNDIQPEQLVVPIEVSAIATEISYYIEGANNIRQGQKEAYCVRSITGERIFVQQTSAYNIDNKKLAKIYKLDNEKQSCILIANDNNLLDSFTLTITVDGQQISKTITVIPLW